MGHDPLQDIILGIIIGLPVLAWSVVKIIRALRGDDD